MAITGFELKFEKLSMNKFKKIALLSFGKTNKNLGFLTIFPSKIQSLVVAMSWCQKKSHTKGAVEAE